MILTPEADIGTDISLEANIGFHPDTLNVLLCEYEKAKARTTTTCRRGGVSVYPGGYSSRLSMNTQAEGAQ